MSIDVPDCESCEWIGCVYGDVRLVVFLSIDHIFQPFVDFLSDLSPILHCLCVDSWSRGLWTIAVFLVSRWMRELFLRKVIGGLRGILPLRRPLTDPRFDILFLFLWCWTRIAASTHQNRISFSLRCLSAVPRKPRECTGSIFCWGYLFFHGPCIVVNLWFQFPFCSAQYR